LIVCGVVRSIGVACRQAGSCGAGRAWGPTRVRRRRHDRSDGNPGFPHVCKLSHAHRSSRGAV